MWSSGHWWVSQVGPEDRESRRSKWHQSLLETITPTISLSLSLFLSPFLSPPFGYNRVRYWQEEEGGKGRGGRKERERGVRERERVRKRGRGRGRERAEEIHVLSYSLKKSQQQKNERAWHIRWRGRKWVFCTGDWTELTGVTNHLTYCNEFYHFTTTRNS